MKRLISVLTIAIMFSTCWVIYSGDGFAASKSTYWLKVNRKCNVVTVYKKSGSEYVPIKAMTCSTGKNNGTPKGTFRVKKKWKWQPLFGNVYGHYTTQFYGNYLFHSVPYKKKNNNYMEVAEYNKLGKQASKGCVRLSTIDARWIYYNCCRGTKVTVYSSSKPGPLGKPAALKMKGKYGYDPTNTDVKSKCRLKGPVISISSTKKKEVEYGASIKLKSGVSARSPYTFQKLTSKVKVYKVYRYSKEGGKYEALSKNAINTKVPGKYKIRYSCHDYYCGFKTVYKNFYLKVLPEPVPEPDPEDEPAVDPTDDTDESDNTEITTPEQQEEEGDSGNTEETDETGETGEINE